MARRFLEALAFGALIAFLFGAWDVRLHHDLAAGMPWLGADRVRSVLPRGLGLGLALGAFVSLAAAAIDGERRRAARITAAAGSAASAFAAWRAASPLVYDAWSRAFWNRNVLTAAVALGIAGSGCILASVWILDLRRSARGGADPLPRARTTVAAVFVVVALIWQAAVPWALARRAIRHPSVVLVSLDTLRADRLGFMGYGRPTSPLLDIFAAEGTVFEQASSASSWTLPSHVSLFTGLLPYDHRILHVGQRVRPELRMLAERFRDRGYRTAAFTGGGYVSWGYGFDQGFEIFEDHDEMREGGPGRIAEHAREWVRGRRGEPFFLFVHSYETHGPYTHGDFADPADRGRLPEGRSESPEGVLHDPTPRERKYIVDLYDGDVLHADRVVGGLLRDLRSDGLLTDTIVIVTSDHGEDLWDHLAEDIPAHGTSLYEEIAHVPLLAWGPGRVAPGCRVSSPVSHLDLPSTLLDLAGVDDAPSFPGRSLAPALRSCAEPEVLPVLAEGIRYGQERFSRREGSNKAIVEPSPPSGTEGRWGTARAIEVYDLAVDPRERTNRAASASVAERELVEGVLLRIRSTERRGDPGHALPLSKELEEQLRSLGYVR